MSDWISKRQMVDKIEDLFLDKYEEKANSDLTGFFKEVLKILVNDKGQPWISVKDRLPDEIGKVLVIDNGKVDINSWAGKYEGWYYANKNITHWMPFPEPPKENNNDRQ